MLNSQNVLLVLLLEHQACCFVRAGQSAWRHERLHGEPWYPLRGENALEAVLGELSNRINNADGLAQFTLHVIYDTATRSHLAHVVQTLHEVQCTHWQVLQWETLRDRAARLHGSAPALPLPSFDWLQQGLLPVLDAAFSDHEDTLAAAHRHADAVARLNADRMQLEAEIARQRQQLAAQQRPAIDDLLTYLPALYRHVFSSIAPHDLALLAGSLQAPQISSPWPEPAPDTVQALQSRLRKLPEQRAQQLRDFCLQLPHRLELRAEMRTWLGED